MLTLFKTIKELSPYRDELPEASRHIFTYLKLSLYAIAVLSMLAIFISILKTNCIEYSTLLNALEIFSLILLGITSSFFVSASFAYFMALYDAKNASNSRLKSRFKTFFRCCNNNEYDQNDDQFDKVAIILPRYYNIKDQKTYESIEDDIKKEIQANHKDGKERYLLGSVKIFKDSAAISFSQSDTIAAATIVALFSKMNMRMPTILTDIQGLYNFFEYSYSQLDRDKRVEYVYEDLKEKIGEQKLEKIAGSFEQFKKHLNNPPKRKYDTYIAVGMFSNAFLMDLINADESDKIEKAFRCVSYEDETGSIRRRLEIKRNNDDSYKIGGIKVDENNSNDDYALISKVKYGNQQIIVCAGITAVGTEAAATYLANKWENIYLSLEKDEIFAIVLKINIKNTDAETILSLEPLEDYPRGRFSSQRQKINFMSKQDTLHPESPNPLHQNSYQ